MSVFEQIRKNERRQIMVFSSLLWAAIKLVVAYFLITEFDEGIFVVLGYILYSLESNSSLIYVNSQEVTEKLTSIPAVNPLDIPEVKQKIDDLEFRMLELEIRTEEKEE